MTFTTIRYRAWRRAADAAYNAAIAGLLSPSAYEAKSRRLFETYQSRKDKAALREFLWSREGISI